MIQQYFKQAWQLLKENKLYSAIYIAGTALAITMVMLIAVFIYLKKGSIYPEENRDRILYVGSIEIHPKDTTVKSMSSSNLSLQTVKQVFYPLQSPSATSALLNVYGEEDLVSSGNHPTGIPVVTKYVDANFWKVFKFHFHQGKPFTEEEFQSGIHTAVISELLEKQLFGNEPSTGKYLKLNGTDYRITGVVKDASFILSDTYANIWLPYTTNPIHERTFAAEGILGGYSAFMLARSSKDFKKIKEELEDNIRKYEANLTWKIDMLGQPDNILTHSFRQGNRPLDMGRLFRMFAGLLVVFLLVPTLNLSGLNSSRMEKRLSELGIRKAFGASQSTLIRQMLVENLLLTFLGGIAGLIVSYAIVVLSKQWLIPSTLIFTMSDPFAQTSDAVGITTQMLFNVEMFLWAFAGVLLINILSAIVPAYRFAKKEIIHSLYNNNN